MLAVDADYQVGRLVLRVRGELDLATAPAFRQATVRLLGEASAGDPRRDVVVDLTACDHLDSVGVGLLLGVLKRARQAGGTLTVVCDEARLRRVLELTEVDRILPVVDRLAPAEPATGAE